MELGRLVARVGEAVDRYRAGELDAFDVDRVLFPIFAGGEGTVEVLRLHGRRARQARAATGRARIYR